MHIVLHKIEAVVDRLIPPLLAGLLVVIVGELFFSHQFEWYKHYADWFDGLVILVFATDLSFKYSRIRKLPTFAKKYWLEIIATIPFFLIFRLFEFFKLSDLLETSQAFAHEGAAAEKLVQEGSVAGKIEREAAIIAKEAARAGEVSRTARMINTFRAIGRFPRFVSALGRSPRFLNALHFFEKPTGQHHWHEKIRGGKSS